MVRVIKVTLFTFLAAAVLSTTFGAGYILALTAAPQTPVVQIDREPGTTARAGSRNVLPQLAVLDEIWSVLNQDFVDQQALDPSKLGRGAVDGLIAALGDRHTTYIDAESVRAEQTGIRGSYEGIGASVALNQGAITIVAPIAGSPAEKAGIRAGDTIVEVNGKSTQGMSLEEVVSLIKGPKGTSVRILIQRESGASVSLDVTRDEIRTQSVILEMLPDGYARVRIVQFTQRTGTELNDALEQVRNQRAKGIILDLRNNPGGLLDTTVESANQFLSGGLAGYQVDRNEHRAPLSLDNGGRALDIPMVVLVNGGSASGSELLAGALQDRGRAKLIGTQTFGKGSVNHLRQLSDGSALYVTIGRWLTPNGTQIEGNGLTPDIVVNVTEEDIRDQRDPQLERAKEVLSTQSR